MGEIRFKVCPTCRSRSEVKLGEKRLGAPLSRVRQWLKESRTMKKDAVNAQVWWNKARDQL